MSALALSLAACGGDSDPAESGTTTESSSAETTAVPTESETVAEPTESETVAEPTESETVAEPTAPAGEAGAITGTKDATPASKFVIYDGFDFASATFPKTLGGMPMLSDPSESDFVRNAGYSKTGDRLSYTVVLSKNSGETDADDFVQGKPDLASYDGGQMICYTDKPNDSVSCQMLLKGSLEVATVNVRYGDGTTDEAAKVMAEWVGTQGE